MAVPGTNRPLYTRPYPLAWLLLAATVAASVAIGATGTWEFDVSLSPFSVETADRRAINFDVYWYAAQALVEGENFYQVHPPEWDDFYYLYPPITVLVFLPFLVVDPFTAYWIYLGINVLVGAALTVLIVRYVESMGRPLGWIDAGLIFATTVYGTYLLTNHLFGNINLLLGAGVGAGLYLLETGERTPGRERAAGAFLAVVALFKVFPALIGLYLLRIRAWAATAAAIAVGAGGLLVGEVLFAIGLFGWDTGDRALGFGMTERWLREAVIPRGATDSFVGGFDPGGTYYVTIQRPLSHVLWTLFDGPDWLLKIVLVWGSIGIGVAVALAFLRRVETRTDRLVAAFVCVVVAVTVMPALQWYSALLLLPMIGLAYVLEDHPVQPVFVAGGMLLAYSNSPADTLAELDAVPGVVRTAVEPVVATVTPQLLGMTVMVAALAVYELRYAVGQGLPERARERRAVGPPLRTWLAARGIDLPGEWDPTRRWGGPAEPQESAGTNGADSEEPTE